MISLFERFVKGIDQFCNMYVLSCNGKKLDAIVGLQGISYPRPLYLQFKNYFFFLYFKIESLQPSSHFFLHSKEITIEMWNISNSIDLRTSFWKVSNWVDIIHFYGTKRFYCTSNEWDPNITIDCQHIAYFEQKNMYLTDYFGMLERLYFSADRVNQICTLPLTSLGCHHN